MPEPLTLPTLEEVEKHFRATHKDSIIKLVETLIVAGLPSRSLRDNGLQRLIPVRALRPAIFQGQQNGHARQRRAADVLDIESAPVSENIKRIIEYINGNAKCTRKKLIEALAPTPKVAKTPVTEIPVVRRLKVKLQPPQRNPPRPKRRRNRRRSLWICTGSFIKARFWNSPMAGWKRRRNLCPNGETGKENCRRKTRCRSCHCRIH